MYLNFFARQWCDDRFKVLFHEISQKFDIYALTLQHDKVYHPTFKERCITHIIVESSDDMYIFDVNDKLTYSDYIHFDEGYDEFASHNTTTTKNDIHLHTTMKSEVESTLGIDNNVNQDKNTKITFCLNDYTLAEREKIIAFLMNVDGNSPEVYIDIDLSACTKEQSEHLSNILVCASIETDNID